MDARTLNLGDSVFLYTGAKSRVSFVDLFGPIAGATNPIIGETGDNCNTGHVVTGDPTPRENDLRWLF